MEHASVLVLGCARKHGLNELDIENAIAYAWAARYRNFNPPAHIAIAGPDAKGDAIEVLAALQEDGTLIVYHAMKLTKKMSFELGLI